MPTKVVHAIGLPGLQRVVSICNLELGDEQNPKIQVLFRKLKSLGSSNSSLEYTDEETAVTVPLGEIISLQVGTVLDNDVPIANPGTQNYKIAVDFRHGMSGCIQRKDLEEFGLSAQLPKSEVRTLIKPEEAWWYMAPSLDPRFKKILFIATSIFTTWYAQSSRMAAKMVLGEFDDMSKNFVNRTRTKSISPQGNGYITLKRGVLTADVITVARAWYDEALFRKRIHALRAHLNIQVRENSNPPDPKKVKLNLRCAPPIESIVELEVQGIPISSAGNELPRLLVLGVISSNEPLPFNTLEAHIDQTLKSHGKPEPTGNGGPPGKPEFTKSPEDFAKEFLKLDGNETTPGPATPVIAPIRIVATRLTKLTEQPDIVRRLSKPCGKKKRPRKEKTSKNTTARSKSSGDPDNRQTEATTSNPGQDGNSDDPNDTLSPNEAITSVLNAFKILLVDGVSITSRCVTEAKYEFRGHILNVVPERANARTQSWTHILGQMRRPVLIAELSLDENYVYILEIIRNVGDQFSTLVFCHVDKRRIEDQTLKMIFRALDSAKQLPSDASIRLILRDSLNAEAQSDVQLAVVKRVRHITTDGSVLAYWINTLLISDLPSKKPKRK